MPDLIQKAVDEFATAVYIQRRKRGWTQKQLGERIGESEATVSRAMTGAVTPQAVAVRNKIANILEIGKEVAK